MAVLRGTLHGYTPSPSETLGLVSITNDNWNAKLSQVGFLPVRSTFPAFEQPYTAPLANGSYTTAARVVSLAPPEKPGSIVGPTQSILSLNELVALEDTLVDFFQIGRLLSNGTAGGFFSAAAYPLWSNIYWGPKLGEKRKRYLVVSPNAWNATSDMVSCVRLTSQFKYDNLAFPSIANATSRACCGDTTTFRTTELLLDPRNRPTPSAVSTADMRDVAIGLAHVYELRDALSRQGISLPG